MAAIEKARTDSQAQDWPDRIIVTRHYERPGGVMTTLEMLRMAQRLDRYRETARMVLEPWIIEAALARFGDRRLTPDE